VIARRGGRAILAPVAMALTLVGVACGRPSGAVEIPPGDLPFGVQRSASPSSSPSPQPSEQNTFAIFLVTADHLVEVERNLAGAVPTPITVLQALLQGPTLTERAAKIDTAVPFQTRMLTVQVLDQVAEVDLSAEFQTPAPPHEVLLRVAQIVWTLVRVPGVTAVRFAIDGDPITVLTDRGIPVSRPVTAPDYASEAPVTQP
jgi:Sporulation and spore germination